MLKAAMKNPDQSIGQRSQRLVMRFAPQAKGAIVTPGEDHVASLKGGKSPSNSIGWFSGSLLS